MARFRQGAFARLFGALALLAALLPAGAAPVAFSFAAPVTAGPFAGAVGIGTIRFDDTFVGLLAPDNSDLSIEFQFLGKTFVETNDSGYPGFPNVAVVDGVPVFIDFVLRQGESGVDFGAASILEVALQGTLLPGSSAVLTAPIDVVIGDPVVVPEPASLGLVALALFALSVRQRRGETARR